MNNKKQSKLKVTATVLIRWAGLFAILAGILAILYEGERRHIVCTMLKGKVYNIKEN